MREVSGEFSEALNAEGAPNKDHQITGGRPVYLYDILQKRSGFPGSRYPFDLSPAGVYRKGDCAVAEEAFEGWITMDLFEHYTEADIQEMAWGAGKVAYHLSKVSAHA